MSSTIRILAAALSLSLCLSSCGSGATPSVTQATHPAPKAKHVQVRRDGQHAKPRVHSGVFHATAILQKNGLYAFKPHTIYIMRGTSIVWTNRSNAPHTVTDGKGAWSSNAFTFGHSYQRRFTKLGTTHYYCELHAYMHGVIVVVRH